MSRRVLAAAVVVLTWVAASSDLSACGDKFLRIGRGARHQRYAAAHPASVLIVYRAATWSAEGLKQFQMLLKGAGHRPVAVEHSALQRTLAEGKYDVVITAYADAASIASGLGTRQSKPGVLPILYKPAKSVEARAEKEYPHLIITDRMNKYGALEEIDHVMGQRLRENSAAAASR